MRLLLERLTFRQIYQATDQGRKLRSRGMRGPPLEIFGNQNEKSLWFNFKDAIASTTGLRHKGYIKFFKPRTPKNLENMECEVSCGCPDFRYRWAWSLKQRGSSQVGPNSISQTLNRSPHITNPTNKISACKHILGLSQYIFGQTTRFPEGVPDSEKLTKIVDQNRKRYINLPHELQKAKDREVRNSAAVAARRRGEEPEPTPPEVLEEPPGETPAGGEGADIYQVEPEPAITQAPIGQTFYKPQKKMTAYPKNLKAVKKTEDFLPAPLEQEEPENIYTQKPPPLAPIGQIKKPVPKTRKPQPNILPKPQTPGGIYPKGLGGLPTGESLINARVVREEQRITTMNKSLIEAAKLVEEVENSYQDEIPPAADVGSAGSPTDAPAPEAPQGGGEEVLALLREIRDLLSELATDEEIEEEPMPEPEDEEMKHDEEIAPVEGEEGRI